VPITFDKRTQRRQQGRARGGVVSDDGIEGLADHRRGLAHVGGVEQEPQRSESVELDDHARSAGIPREREAGGRGTVGLAEVVAKRTGADRHGATLGSSRPLDVARDHGGGAFERGRQREHHQAAALDAQRTPDVVRRPADHQPADDREQRIRRALIAILGQREHPVRAVDVDPKVPGAPRERFGGCPWEVEQLVEQLATEAPLDLGR
jgi:hypothetical protein